jgi:hypothetical protein
MKKIQFGHFSPVTMKKKHQEFMLIFRSREYEKMTTN